jgi:hypothetical protein
MKTLIAFCLAIVLMNACTKPCVEPNPDCIQSKIDHFKTSTNCTQNASVKMYGFQGKTVYVFDETQCKNVADGGAEIFDSNCNYLGLIGGIAGVTKINGVEFYENADYIKTVWHN